jgi:hypothetical protein
VLIRIVLFIKTEFTKLSSSLIPPLLQRLLEILLIFDIAMPEGEREKEKKGREERRE